MTVEVLSPGGSVTVQTKDDSVVIGQEKAVISVSYPFSIGGAPYEGEYEAKPKFTKQVFQTANKSMLDDFTVKAINYTEAPNDYGKTVTIGG